MCAPVYSKFLDGTRKKTNPEPSSLVGLKKQSLQLTKAKMNRMFTAKTQKEEDAQRLSGRFADGSLKFLAQCWYAPVCEKTAQDLGKTHWKGIRRTIPRAHTGPSIIGAPASQVERPPRTQSICQSH